MKIILIILLSSVSVLAQLKPFIFGVGSSINDTTTNIYVVTSLANDNGDGLTYETAKKYLPSALSLVDAPTDTVFIVGNLPDSTYTNTKNCVITAYNLSNPPLLYGGDTVDYSHSYAWQQINTVSSDTNVNYFSSTSTTVTSAAADRIWTWRVYVANPGKLWAYMVYHGINSDADVVKLCLNTRTNSDITMITDSCQVIDTTAANTWNVSRYWGEGKYLSDTVWFSIVANSTISVPIGTSTGETETTRGYKDSGVDGYENFPAASYSTLTFDKQTDIAVGIITKTETGGLDSNKYYAIFPDTTYQVFLSGILGTEVSDASLVDTLKEWHYKNDTLYVNRYTDTSAVEATTRDGFLVTSQSTISGFKIEKTRYGITATGTIDSLTLSRNEFTNNIQAILDSSAGDALYANNLFDNNTRDIKLVSKDSAYVRNNSFYSAGDTSLLSINTKLFYENNLSYTEAYPRKAWIIDDLANVKALNFNAYASSSLSLGRIGAVEYDSLPTIVSNTDFEDNSFQVKTWKAEPYNSFTKVWTNMFAGDFSLRLDSLITSPAIDAGTNLGLETDIIGNPIPDALTDLADMGAYEKVLSDEPPASPFNVLASMVGDSAYITYEYDFENDLDSARIHIGSTWIASVGIGSFYYHHPTRSSTSSIPGLTALNVVGVNDDSATVSFRIKTNNDTTSYRIRYGIGSLSDSTVSADTFIFIPQATTYGVRLLDTAGQTSGLVTSALTWIDSTRIYVTLIGLTASSGYMWDVTALNDNGWVNSSDGSFTTTSGATLTADFYVSPWGGGDTLTYSQIVDLTFAGGDTILFLKGYTYKGAWTIRRTAGIDTVYIDSYGIGLKPILTLKDSVNGAMDGSNWSAVSGLTNVWRMTLLSDRVIDRLWLSGSEVKLAGWYKFEPTVWMEYLQRGDNGDGTYGVCPEHPFHHYKGTGYYLHVYAASNPATVYSSFEIPAPVISGALVRETILIKDADYITINGLDIQGGGYASLGLAGADYITITNCNIGKNSNYAAIAGDRLSGTDKKSNYVTVSNDTIDSHWDYDYVFYTQRTPYGMYIDNSSYWDIHDNYIKDWWMGIYIIGTTGLTQYHNFYNNEVTSSVSLSKGMQIGGAAQYGQYYTNVYNNYFHNLKVGVQMSSSIGNKVYYNIFENLVPSTNSHSTGSNSGWGVSMGEEYPELTSDSNTVFNNTFYDFTNQVCMFPGEWAKFSNNLMLYTNQRYPSGGVTRATANRNQTYKNNLFFYPSRGSSDDMITLQLGSIPGTYTTSEFNALNGQEELTISDNLQHVGVIEDLINTSNFTLPTGSPALNASDTTSVLRLILDAVADENGDFFDRQNNLILDNHDWYNFEKPHIGAIKN